VRREITLHGHAMSYLEAGATLGAPVVVLVHGLAGQAASWDRVVAALGPDVHVLIPDLLGHGRSAAPPGADYSVGAHASRLRDLLRALGHERANVVGHSLGGGVAIAFAYQFPERADSLTLISSGGLGPELSVALRVACLPGLPLAAHLLATLTPAWVAHLVCRVAAAVGLACDADLAGLGESLHALHEPGARRAFLATLRGVASVAGQRLDATGLLDLLADLPIVLIAGRHDRCIPCHHAQRAHRLLPGSRLAVFDSGHFPHTEHPDRVAEEIRTLLGSLHPAPDPRWGQKPVVA
jgi:pimeloyl-ACP methyl ester carboxylesterase